jgi:heavy metal sensor kinase
VVTGAVGSGAERRLIQIATSLESYESELAELHSVLWMILPAGLIVATAGGYWLATRALSPVQRMTEAAQRISASNLSDRIDLLNVDDELGRLGLTLNAMLDRICHAFAANRRFTADAAHELKTPLASIRAEAEVALLCTRTLSEYEATLRGIVEEVERLTRLTEQLLRLAREDSGATLSRQSTRLDVAVRAAVNNATLAASDAGVALHLGELARAEVNCDQDLLRQVFDILLDNAVKYTPAGGAVTLSARCHAGHVIVEVADTGVGIPDEELARVFDRFYRVDSSRSRRTGGTGLGLSIAKAMIERHGGTTDATSKPGLGSTFRVVLPTCGDESQLCSYHDI